MQLSHAQRHYLLREHIIGSALFNAVLNALLGWLTFRGLGHAPIWGNPSAVADLLSTSFFLPFLTSLIATPLIAMAVRRGKAEPLASAVLRTSPIGKLPGGAFLRGLILGLVCLAVCAGPVLGMLSLMGSEPFSVGGYALLKAVFSALLAAVVSPIIALFALESRAAA
jgi:hypothetical protein